MKNIPFAPLSLAALLAATLAVAQAQPASTDAGKLTADAASSAASTTGKASSHAKDANKTHKAKKSKKAKPPASNPGTSGGAGNKSGSTRRDGADFDAPRPGAATSAPTGTGWDGYDAR